MRIDGDESVGGAVRRGLGGDVNALQCAAARVVVLGMGAFAIENMRTCLERGAAHVTILCRRRGTACPQIVDWVNFIRPFDDEYKHSAAGDAVVLDHWQKMYDTAGAARPECWAAGMLKPDGHTISVSDIFFIAYRLRMLITLLGEVARLDGVDSVLTRAAERLRAGIVIKCVGFELNEGNERLLGRVCMCGFGMVESCLWLQIEPHLDGGAFTSPFGSSYLNQARFNASLMQRYWQDRRLSARLERAELASSRINTLPASEALQGSRRLVELDSGVVDLLHDHIMAVATACNAMMSPAEYSAENMKLWEANFDMLLRAAPDAASARLAYPFANLFVELPDLEASGRGDCGQRAVVAGHANAVSLFEVLEAARKVAGSSSIDADAPLMDTGLDSLGATELRSSLQDAVGDGAKLPATLLFDSPTARQIASALASDASSSSTRETVERQGTHEGARSEATVGWVRSFRQAAMLSDAYFPTIWYSSPMSLSDAVQMFQAHATLRTGFTFDARTERWRWSTILRDALPVYDAHSEQLVFTDRATPFFYEASRGVVLLNHTIWDAFSVVVLLPGAAASRHFSENEERVSRLHAAWEDGYEQVDAVLRGPKLFDTVTPYVFCERTVKLPLDAIHMVKRFCARSSVPLETAWHAFIMALSLQCAEKSAAVFWLQASNRDAENSDVFGYVTTEVGLLAQVTPNASFERRLSECLEALAAISLEQRNVFPEIAIAHPMYETFNELSLGINLLGNAPDNTDRSIVQETLGDAFEGGAFFGTMNWVEIGDEINDNVMVHGRIDIVQFVTDTLLPALGVLANGWDAFDA